MKKALLAVGLVTITGCATHYAAPSSGPTAFVTFSASGIRPGAWILVQNFASESCEPSPNGTRLATFTTTPVQGRGDPHSGVNRAMAANRPVVVTFAYQAGAMGLTDTEACTLTQTFVPQAGSSYRMDVSVTRVEAGITSRVEETRKVEPVCISKLNG